MTKNGYTRIYASASDKTYRWYKRGVGTITVTPDGCVAHREHPDRVSAPYKPLGSWSEAVLYLEGKS